MLDRKALVAVAAVVGVAVASTVLSARRSNRDRGGSANDAARDAIERLGVDPSSDRTYEHFLYFADEAGARGAEQDLLEEGFDVQVNRPSDGIDEWSLLALQTVALSEEQLDELTTRMEAIASRHGGTYDGWGTALG